jgi:hypothetical protein
MTLLLDESDYFSKGVNTQVTCSKWGEVAEILFRKTGHSSNCLSFSSMFRIFDKNYVS